MGRQLRPRKPTAPVNVPTDDEAGPSKVMDDQDSGSEFAPEGPAATVADEEEEESEEEPEASEEELGEEESVPAPRKKKGPLTKPKSKAKSAVNVYTRLIKPLPQRASGLSGSARRQNYALPAPKFHHRHKAIPLWMRSGHVERLTSRPVLFEEPELASTVNYTHSLAITDRVSKAWGYNVGPGPIWEMAEDRGWYKESQSNLDTEETRRPSVHANVRVNNGFKVLSNDEARPYLPSDSVATDQGELQDPPPVTCSFGPFDSQTKLSLEMFDTVQLADYFDGSESHVLNAGAPVWGIDWCPIYVENRESRSYTQYLAVAPFPSDSHSPDIGVRAPRPYFACIQIWSLGADTGLTCEMVICHNSGPAQDLKWCPLPSDDSLKGRGSKPRKLGLLAGTFEDGSFSIYAVPEPSDLRPKKHDMSKPFYVHLPEPVLRIELDETACWSFDWANSELVAIGTTNGILAVYNLGPALKALEDADSPITNLLPTHYITVHQSAIRAVAWIKAPPGAPPKLDADPTVIATGGYDGLECVTDIREGHGSIMNRTRDVINTVAFSHHGGGPVTIDHENIVKSFSLSPIMLGRGHTLLEPLGPVWSLNCSELHPQLAVGSADGTCMTTNLLRGTRRNGAVPFFAHKIYQLDFSRNEKEFRMLERFFPIEAVDRPTAAAKSKASSRLEDPFISTGAWPRQVGVQRVVWNSSNGLGNAGLLASATSSGLCRIDNLRGKWIRGKMPYTSVEAMRDEGKADVSDDSS
ncbi:WD40-repeat-containing domain protein [Mycena floridula]|nr:WD40-repeat-containing domain protein [Mycena floridula]